MKFLILSLLFLTGTQGGILWQNDEPATEDGTESYSKFIDNIVELGSKVFDYLESSDKDKEQKIKKAIKALQHDGEAIAKEIVKSFDDAQKEIEKELNEKYPVFMTKMVPLLEDFHKRWTKHMLKVKKDASVVVHNLFGSLKKQIDDFLENIQPVLEKGRDKIREDVEALRAKIAPIKAELHEELQRNRKEAQAELEKFRETVDKEVAELTQTIKQCLEKLKESNPGAEDIKSYLNKLLDEIKDAFYTDQH